MKRWFTNMLFSEWAFVVVAAFAVLLFFHSCIRGEIQRCPGISKGSRAICQ